MSVVYVVLPASIVLVVIAVALFFWAVRRGQFDDLETPGLRMLHDDDDELDAPSRRAASSAEHAEGADRHPEKRPPGEAPR